MSETGRDPALFQWKTEERKAVGLCKFPYQSVLDPNKRSVLKSVTELQHDNIIKTADCYRISSTLAFIISLSSIVGAFWIITSDSNPVHLVSELQCVALTSL